MAQCKGFYSSCTKYGLEIKHSASCPITIEAQNPPREPINVQLEYAPDDGVAVPDARVEKHFKSYLISLPTYHKDYFQKYSTENIFTRFRIALVEGDIDSLTIVKDGKKYPVEKNGNFRKQPVESMFPTTDDLLGRLIRAKLNQKQEEKLSGTRS